MIDLRPHVRAGDGVRGHLRQAPDGQRYEVEQIQDLFEHGEAREGITAFLEKRAPTFP